MSVTPTSGIIRPIPAAWAVESSSYVAVPFGRTLQMYDVSEDTPRHMSSISEPHQQNITSLLSVPGMQFVTASLDATLKFWDVLEGHCLKTLDTINPVMSMCHIRNSLLVLTDQSLIHYPLPSPASLSIPPNSASTITTSNPSKNPAPPPPPPPLAMHSGLRTLIKFSTDIPFSKIAAFEDLSLVAMIAGKRLYLLSDLNAATPPVKTGSGSSYKVLKLRFPSQLTSLAVSKSNHLAVGDSVGRIYFISNPSLSSSSFKIYSEICSIKSTANDDRDSLQNLKSVDLKLVSQAWNTLHWHASPVQSLSFTNDGAYLLSGGQEAVLVCWTISTTNYGSRSFFPRVGAPILAISSSPDEQSYSLSLADNSVSLMNHSERTVTGTIRSIACRVQLRAHETISNIIDEPCIANDGKFLSICPNVNDQGHILVANDNTRIQQFDVIRGEHIRNIGIVPMNENYSDFKTLKQHSSVASDSNKPSLDANTTCNVSRVCMHPNGQFMATVDEVNHAVFIDNGNDKAVKSVPRTQKALTLRIWEKMTTRKENANVSKKWSKKSQSNKDKQEEYEWKLSALINNPHGTEEDLYCLEFHPTMNLLFTSGSDGKFKFWRATVLTKRGPKKNPSISWRCELIKTYRDQNCKSASFSSDGSLLALGCGSVIALYEITDYSSETSKKSNSLVEFNGGCSIGLEFYQPLIHVPIDDDIENIQFVMCDIPLFIAVTKKGIYSWNCLTQNIWWSCGVQCDPSTLAVDNETGRFAIVTKIDSLVVEGNDSAVKKSQDCKQVTSTQKSKTGKQPKLPLDAMEVIEEDENNETKHAEGKKRKRRGHNSSMSSKANISHHHNDNDVEKSNLTNGSHRHVNNRKKTSNLTNSAITIFNANSPVPIGVHRLDKGLHALALRFVSTSAKERNQKTDVNDPPSHGKTALVCINSDFDVSVMTSDGDNTNDFSMTSDEPITAELNSERDNENGRNLIGDSNGFPNGRLGSLFGDQWQQEVKAIANVAEVQSKSDPSTESSKLNDKLLQSAFADHLAGPIHAQAPVSFQSLEFARTLLNSNDADNSDEDGDGIDTYVEGEKMVVEDVPGTRNDTNTKPGMVSAYYTSEENTKAETDVSYAISLNQGVSMKLEEMVNFCEELLENEKVDDSKDGELVGSPFGQPVRKVPSSDKKVGKECSDVGGVKDSVKAQPPKKVIAEIQTEFKDVTMDKRTEREDAEAKDMDEGLVRTPVRKQNQERIQTPNQSSKKKNKKKKKSSLKAGEPSETVREEVDNDEVKTTPMSSKKKKSSGRKSKELEELKAQETKEQVEPQFSTPVGKQTGLETPNQSSINGRKKKSAIVLEESNDSPMDVEVKELVDTVNPDKKMNASRMSKGKRSQFQSNPRPKSNSKNYDGRAEPSTTVIEEPKKEDKDTRSKLKKKRLSTDKFNQSSKPEVRETENKGQPQVKTPVTKQSGIETPNHSSKKKRNTRRFSTVIEKSKDADMGIDVEETKVANTPKVRRRMSLDFGKVNRSPSKVHPVGKSASKNSNIEVELSKAAKEKQSRVKIKTTSPGIGKMMSVSTGRIEKKRQRQTGTPERHIAESSKKEMKDARTSGSFGGITPLPRSKSKSQLKPEDKSINQSNTEEMLAEPGKADRGQTTPRGAGSSKSPSHSGRQKKKEKWSGEKPNISRAGSNTGDVKNVDTNADSKENAPSTPSKGNGIDSVKSTPTPGKRRRSFSHMPSSKNPALSNEEQVRAAVEHGKDKIKSMRRNSTTDRSIPHSSPDEVKDVHTNGTAEGTQPVPTDETSKSFRKGSNNKLPSWMRRDSMNKKSPKKSKSPRTLVSPKIRKNAVKSRPE